MKKVLIALALCAVSANASAIGKDKKFHFAAGCGVAIATHEILREKTSFTPLERAQASILVGAVVGALKESWDRGRKGHTSDIADFNATAAGSAVCTGISFSF